MFLCYVSFLRDEKKPGFIFLFQSKGKHPTATSTTITTRTKSRRARNSIRMKCVGKGPARNLGWGKTDLVLIVLLHE
jgi:hypothetical protein